MIHPITKALDERDERGIYVNIWMKLYETSDSCDKHDKICQGIIDNGFSFNIVMNIIRPTQLATMLENQPRSHS